MHNFFGSVLATCDIEPKTAYGWSLKLRKGSIINRIIGVIGLPHLGARVRNHLLLRMLPRSSGELALDVGCGIGLHTMQLTQKGYKTTGTDLSFEKISQARRLADSGKFTNIKFLKDDITNTKLHSETFHKIVLLEVIEHVKDDNKLLLNIDKLLKQGGNAVISFPSLHPINKKVMKQVDHVHAGYSPKEIQKMIINTDLNLIEVLSFGNTVIGRTIFKVDYILISITPWLSGFFFIFAYPWVVFDSYLPCYGMPMGYVIKLEKKSSK